MPTLRTAAGRALSRVLLPRPNMASPFCWSSQAGSGPSGWFASFTMTIRRTPAAAQDGDPSLLEELSYLAWHPRPRSWTIPARRRASRAGRSRPRVLAGIPARVIRCQVADQRGIDGEVGGASGGEQPFVSAAGGVGEAARADGSHPTAWVVSRSTLAPARGRSARALCSRDNSRDAWRQETAIAVDEPPSQDVARFQFRAARLSAVVIGQRARGGCLAGLWLMRGRPPGAIVRAWCPDGRRRTSGG